MTHSRYCLFALLLISTVDIAQGQIADIQVDTIQWNANSLTDLNAGATVANVCQFVTYGSQKVDWVQNNGGFITSFSIINVIGDWHDPNILGSIVFVINSGQLNGQLTIERTMQELKISLKVAGGTGDINLTYNISSKEKQ